MSAAAFAAVAAFFMVVFCKHQKPRVFIHVIIFQVKTIRFGISCFGGNI